MEDLNKKLTVLLKYFNEEKYKEALVISRDLIQPDYYYNDIALYFHGLICFKLGFLDEAEQYVKKAIEINPIVDYYKDLGFILWEKKDITGAVEAYLNIIEVQPDANVLFTLGNFLIECKEYQNAIKCIEQSLSLEPDNINAFHSIAEAYFKLAEASNQKDCYKKAISYYNKVLSKQPDDVLLNLGIANAYNGVKDFDNAIKFYNKIIQLDPTSFAAYVSLGDIYRNHKYNTANAIKYYKKALRLKPDHDQLREIVASIS